MEEDRKPKKQESGSRDKYAPTIKLSWDKNIDERGAWVAQWVKASAFGSGHDLRVLGWSPASGSLLSREPASPLSLCLPLCLLVISLSLSNK